VDPIANPYAPGAGTRPPLLAGREAQRGAIEVALGRLLIQRNGKSQILTGLRGVGKTVLLTDFAERAVNLGYAHHHIEVAEDGNLPIRLVIAFRFVALHLSAAKKAGAAARRFLGILKAFSLTLPDGTRLNFDVDLVSGPADSGDLSTDFAGLFVELGQLARSHESGVFITIDELHYVDLPVYSALILGLHRANQLRLPITVAGAGLPSLPALTGEAKSYAERMFRFPVIDSLDRTRAFEALAEPAAEQDVEWDEDALERVWVVTKGYPYFLQEFGSATWDIAEGPAQITLADVERAIPLAVATLDEDFFSVRTGKLPPSEKRYLRAMAELAPAPVKSASVAKALGKNATNAAGPLRDSLIKKGLIYAPAWGDVDFTVPLFDAYMRRWVPKFTPPATTETTSSPDTE
jgi:hypothetical protein